MTEIKAKRKIKNLPRPWRAWINQFLPLPLREG